jgi:hypothetical protein
VTSLRFFLYEQDGTLRRLSVKLTDRLCRGLATLPQYANQRLRLATVYLRRGAGKDFSVTAVEGTFFDFDEQGGAQQALVDGAMALWSAGDEAKAVDLTRAVVDARPIFAYRGLQHRLRWKPTKAEIEKLAAAALPASGRKVTVPFVRERPD